MTAARPGPRPLVLSAFRGVRFAADRIGGLAAVTSPPYDVLDADTITTLRAAEPHNIVHLILPRAANPDGDEHYRRAGELFRTWLDDGILLTDPDPALYVYEQVVEPHRTVLQRGLLGAIGLRTPEERVILPHEDVMPGPVADRLALMRACAANLEPILLVYDGGGPASDIAEETATTDPLLTARTPDGIEHRLWQVTDPARLDAIARDLAPRHALIGDGHHRYATYLRLQQEHRSAGDGDGPWDSGLALLVDQRATPVKLTAIHRTLARVDLDDTVSKARAEFAVEAYDTDAAAAHRALQARQGLGHGFLLTDGTRWTLLSAPHRANEQSGTGDGAPEDGLTLDTTVLHDELLTRLLGLAEDRIGYAHDEDGALRAARRDRGLAVLLNPVDVGAVYAVAERGGRMPRKSTSFGPKPRTGLVMRALATG